MGRWKRLGPSGHSWTLVPIVRHNSLNLARVSAISPTNVWAVSSLVNSRERSVEVVGQFDGLAWHIVPDVSLIGQNLQGIVDMDETHRQIATSAPFMAS